MEGTQEDCSLGVVAELEQVKDAVKQLEAHIACQQQGGGGDGAAAGGVQRGRALVSTICASLDRAMAMITSNIADGSPAAGQPGWIPSSGGDGSWRSAVLDPGGGGNAPGQSKDRKTLPKCSTQMRVSAQDATCPDDGFSWRKYGQKDILGAKYPRGYYRCTHRNTHSCPATKQAQRTDDDPLLFDVVYHGVHTCSQGATAAAHHNNQGMLPAAARAQTTASGSEAGSVLTSEVPGLMVSRKGDTEGETPISKNMIEEPPSTPYMDVPPSTPCMDVMEWFAMGKLSQKGRLSHTCMQQAGQELLGREPETILDKRLWKKCCWTRMV